MLRNKGEKLHCVWQFSSSTLVTPLMPWTIVLACRNCLDSLLMTGYPGQLIIPLRNYCIVRCDNLLLSWITQRPEPTEVKTCFHGCRKCWGEHWYFFSVLPQRFQMMGTKEASALYKTAFSSLSCQSVHSFPWSRLTLLLAAVNLSHVLIRVEACFNILKYTYHWHWVRTIAPIQRPLVGLGENLFLRSSSQADAEENNFGSNPQQGAQKLISRVKQIVPPFVVTANLWNAREKTLSKRSFEALKT